MWSDWEANEVAIWLVEAARSRLAANPQDPEALRDLSISLNNVGNTDQALGDWNQARTVFTEGLEIVQRLAMALPRHQDYKDPPDWFEQRLAELAKDQGQGRRMR